MTDSEKLKTPKRQVIFIREDGFYPLELPEGTIADNAACNPGTLRVEDLRTQEVLWRSPEQFEEDAIAWWFSGWERKYQSLRSTDPEAFYDRVCEGYQSASNRDAIFMMGEGD